MHLYGGALQVTFLMRGLQQLGISNVLACPLNSAIAEAAAPVASVRPVSMQGDADLGLLFRLGGLIERENPDLIHLHSRRGADIWGAMAGRWKKVPVVLSRRVDNPERPWVVAVKYKMYDRVITISEGIREVLRHEGVEEERLRCVRSAVDTDHYHPGAGSAEEVRRLFNAAPGQPLIGMVAQLIARKGHSTLLDALPTVLQAQPDLKVILFGQGPERDRIEAHLKANPALRPHVVLAGFRQDLHRILPCLDLIVHPAFMEGLGVSLLQAAACGVPIIGARAGGIPEIVRPGLNGELFEPGDSRALAAAMIDLLASPAKRHMYGQAGREWVQEHFSIPAMVKGNLAVYRELVPD